MTGGEDLYILWKWKGGHCSSMSNSVWYDLNGKGDMLRLHDICPNTRCKGQEKLHWALGSFD